MRSKLIILAFLFLFFGASPALAINQLDVVINEVAWMGTTASANDEWIELYNTTDNPITLDGWILEAEDGTPKINLSGTINPKSYYLLERTNDNTISDITADLIYSNALGNEGERLILKSSSIVIIDQINASSGWFAGDNSTKNTMERINPLDLGDKSINWATNNGINRNGVNESGNQINGTPKNQNSIYLTTHTPSPAPTSIPTPTPSPSPIPTKTPSPSPTPKKTLTPTNTSTSVPSSTPTPKSTPIPKSSKNEISYRIASVAAVSVSATPEGTIEVKDQKQVNPFVWVGLIFIFAGVGTIGYIYLKKNAKIRIKF